ncbi:hypothetical protein EZV62_012332 [Acer yangbiense]|uniref:Uncharacterized protein n=1 Tax=Acer yangbiense TaxID=1000413 RepID=A0A5C7HW57_9ROSI|nr:hypothetical protein EZV62_012332 [Acer yangbiense]
MEYNHCNKGRKVSVLEGQELFFNKVLSRNSSNGCSSRILYYRSAEGVPFKWEMQPGTPKDPPTEDILPPLSPPPAVLSLGLPKPCISIEEPKASMRTKLMFWKHNKNYGEINNKKVQKGREDKFVNLELYSSDGEEYFMGSPCNSSSSSSSSFSFSNVHSSQSSRLQSPARNSMDHENIYGCSPWNFTSLLVRVGRKV